jgi:glutathione synthase/RimK-type ligase-like ATP-grasp enzyme
MTAVILRRRMLGKGSANGICAASTKGIYTIRNWVDNDVPAGADRNGYVFRWGCTSNLPVVYSHRTVVNTANAIHWCSDKRQGRLDMQAAGVPVPRTWATADEYNSSSYWPSAVVLRPAFHAQGRNLTVHDPEESSHQWDGLLNKAQQYGAYYISELINKVAEYRVFVCQNRAVWVAKKTPGNPEQVAWNVAQGGRFDNVRWGEWPLPVIKAALAAAKVSGTDFCGVDVMVDAEGKPYVLEVNSAPSQTSEYRQRCVAKAFDHIIENGKQHFDDVPDGPRKTYKSYIHPAIRPQE